MIIYNCYNIFFNTQKTPPGDLKLRQATEKALEKRHAAIWHVSPLLQLALPWQFRWYPWVWIRGPASKSSESIDSN